MEQISYKRACLFQRSFDGVLCFYAKMFWMPIKRLENNLQAIKRILLER